MDETPVLRFWDVDAVRQGPVDEELTNVHHVVVEDGGVRDLPVATCSAESIVVQGNREPISIGNRFAPGVAQIRDAHPDRFIQVDLVVDTPCDVVLVVPDGLAVAFDAGHSGGVETLAVWQVCVVTGGVLQVCTQLSTGQQDRGEGVVEDVEAGEIADADRPLRDDGGP